MVWWENTKIDREAEMRKCWDERESWDKREKLRGESSHGQNNKSITPLVEHVK